MRHRSASASSIPFASFAGSEAADLAILPGVHARAETSETKTRAAWHHRETFACQKSAGARMITPSDVAKARDYRAVSSPPP